MKPSSFDRPIYVTRSIAPPLSKYVERLETIWETRRFSNAGPLHDEFEGALARHLGVADVALVGNGTLALSIAAKALGVKGDVVTTPFTFAATPHSLVWCGLNPVFADIEPETFTLDPERVEAAITPATTAILAVHVFGNPCNHEALQSIAARRGLRLIFDGAHAFGTEADGRSLLAFGDATTFSLHATKLFHSAEGGGIVASPETMASVRRLRNFGFFDETTIEEPGINSKLSELHAALGLSNLEILAAERAQRRTIAALYDARLSRIAGLSVPSRARGVTNRDQYYPVLVSERARLDRDGLLEALARFNVFARRYFYPLCSEFACYSGLPSSDPARLPIAGRVARQVLCLPFFGELGLDGAERICQIMEYLMRD